MPASSRPPLTRRAGAALALAAALAATGRTGADDDVYQPPEQFIAETFGGTAPEPRVLWLTKPMREAAREILGHEFAALRVRYWADERRTAWILEEIGKVKPITTGLVVADGRIERLKVLVYRESHGWEVRHPFFTDQFRQAGLDERRALDRPIDGIAGATLSVTALKRLAALALYFDRQAPAREPATP